MNILGIGPGPFVIFFLALLLFGPKKMVQFAYQAGQYVAQLRAMWEQTMQAVQKEFQEAGLDLPTDLTSRRFDIGAEAMKVINNTPESPASTATVNTVVTAATVSADASTLPAPPVVGEPTSPTPSEGTPSLNNPSDDEQPKKYDSWLPN